MAEISKSKRWLRWTLLGLTLVLISAVLTLFFYLRSEAFRDRVRHEVIAQLERATGGRVELRSLSWRLSPLQFDIEDLTIHGLEKPNEVPYAHVDHLHVSMKIISLLRRDAGLSELDAQHPVLHLIVYPDGSTNQPSPKLQQSSGAPAESLFQIGIDRLRVSDGLLLLNEERVPLDFRADSASAAITYSKHPEPGYSGHLQVAGLELRRPGSADVLSQAETSFTIRKRQIEVSALHWSSGRSQLDASGKVDDFAHPRVEAQYRITLELSEVAKLLGQNELRGGSADLSGTLRYISTEDFFSSGKLTLKKGAYSSRGLRLASVDATSDYTVDVDRITLTRLAGSALGGSLTGNATIQHWLAVRPKAVIGSGARKRIAPPPQEGTVQLSLSGIQVAEGLRALVSPKSPLDRLQIASRADGNLNIRWTGSPNYADVAMNLTAQAPPSAAPSQLPLTGTMQATYHGRSDRVDVTGLNLGARATRVSATGAIGAQSELRVSLNTSDLSELTPVMQALGSAEGPLPAILHGQASFNGVVKGTLSSPALTGRLQATNFDTVLPAGLLRFGSQLPSTPNHPSSVTHPLHWDSLVADVGYSPTSATARNVILKRGRAQITGWETAVLIDGSLEPESPLEVQIALRNTDLADLQELAGSNYPVTGTFTGQIRMKGTKENLSASGHMQLIGGAIYNEPFHSLSAGVRFQGQEAELQNAVLEQDGGTVTGGVAYTFDTQAFSFHFTGSHFDLAHIARLQSKKFTMGGRAEFEATGSGTVSQPLLNARLSIAALTFSGESEGNLVVTAVSHGPTLHVEGHSNMQFAAASLNGDVQLRDDLPAEIHLDLTKLDFDPLLRVYLAGKVTGHSSVSGKFVLRGPLLHPHQITITGDVEEFFADVQNIKLHNQGPVRFSVSNHVASIQELHLIGTDTEITGSGTVELTGARRIDLHGNGHVNLAMLQTLNSSVTSSGQLTFTMNATGKLDAPSFSGNMQIANGALAFVDLPNGLSEINGTFSFDLNRLRVQRLTAKTGGGNLTLGGYITYSNGMFFDLTATGKDIRIRYPEGVSSQATADLRLVGGVSTSVLSGDVTVTRFALTPQFDLASYVQRAKQPPGPPNPNSIIDNVRLDVHVVSTPELRVETSLARLSGDVDLRLRGTVARPAVMGRLSIAEGDITFNSTTYHLERGDVVFANPVRIEPVINVEASARVRDYDITLGFHGTPDKLNVTYRSEPPLPSADIIALLAFGRTRQESEIQAEQGSQVASSQSFAETASNAILGQALNSAVSSRVQKLFGVSRIKIDPNLGGTEDNPNARLTIEQQISKDVTVTYLTNLGQYAEEVLQVEYNINKNVSLVAVRDYTGVLAIDLRIRQRKR